MKNQILKIFVVFLLFCNTDSFCQYVSPPSIQSKKVNKPITFDLSYKNLVGTVYINENFNSAYISLAEMNYPTRYDAYHDEMEIEDNNEQYYLPKTFDCTVKFKEKTYNVYSYNNKNCFFNVLLKGSKLSLLSKETIKLYSETEGNGIVAYQPPTLKRLNDQAFFGDSSNMAYKLPKNKKDFYSIFSNDSKLIQKFVKDKSLNIKDTSDLIKIFEYYNSLN